MKKVIATATAPKAIGPYSQAIKAGSLLFVSGQIALVPATGTLVEGDVAAQTKQVMQNLAEIIKAADLTLADVIKTTIYLNDIYDFVKVNEVYGSFFTESYPARATVAVKSLPKNALIEIDCIASYD